MKKWKRKNMNKYLTYNQARKYINQLPNIKSASQFLSWHKKNKPKNIPFHPERHYKSKGWLDWRRFLKTSNVWGGNRKSLVNDNYFKTWSHNMAYVLGLWWADGYMYEKYNTFSITQHKKDDYILKIILKDMHSNYNLQKHGGNNWDFKIVSKEILKDLKKIGGMPNKSLKIGFPKNIPNKYLPDFIRGLWDGDGSIYYNKQFKAYVSSILSGSKKLAHELLNILKKEIKNFDGKIYMYRNKYYLLSLCVNDTRRLGKYIYKRPTKFKLYRKYEKFMKTGKINVASFNKIFKSYNEAKNIAQKHKITCYRDWRKKCKKISKQLPVNPDNTYRNCWMGWRKFLGTEVWAYDKAQKYVAKLGLTSKSDWRIFASTKRIKNIPSNPWSVYAEWKGMKEWLANNRERKNGYPRN